MERDLDALEQILGLEFRDRSLLYQSLIHRSFLNENPETNLSSNERLEYLGDAVLDFLAADYLYQAFPDQGEGQLTLLRSALVRTETLAGFARRVHLGTYLILGRGEESDGGRDRSTILADAFEAVVGAVYLDLGLPAARRFLLPFLEQQAEALHGHPPLDYKSALQIRVQGEQGETPRYRTVDSWGPDHACTFRAQVLIGERVVGTGEGPSKQLAEQEAARRALEELGEADNP